MKEIPITKGRDKGRVVLVDDEDFEWLSQWKWSTATGYACRFIRRNRKTTAILMHREIMRAPNGILVDHKNRNRLDNRRENLRLATRSQNNINVGMRKNNTSGYVGVTWAKRINRWIARVRIDGKHRSVGCYETAEEAYEAYVRVAKQIYGEFFCSMGEIEEKSA